MMKYHTTKECCVKLEGLMVIIKGIRMDSLDNVIVVHKSDSAIQLINELLGELNNNKE